VSSTYKNRFFQSSFHISADNMVLIVRSSTDDNLIARANCGTAQVPTTIEGASVGFSIAFLLRYGWTYSKKVAYYAQHLICTDSIYSVPSEESRAVASLSLNTEHSFVSSEESRNAHFAALEASSSESRNEPYDGFGRQFEVIHGGSAFLRAVEDIWGMGEQILSSLSVRILDVDQSDMDATDIFFTFLDLFILAYYNGTNSTCEDARQAVVENMGKFYDIRQCLRTGSRRTGAVGMRESSPIWENSLSGKVALLMHARGMSIDDDDDDEINFQALTNNSPDIPNLAQILGRCKDIRRLADTFRRAEKEYLEKFSNE